MGSSNRHIEELVSELLSRSAQSNFDHRIAQTLMWIVRQTHARTNHAQMLIGEQEGLFLHNFVKEYISGLFSESADSEDVISVNILELGTFTGYSLICLASAIKPFISQGKKILFSVDALEINDELEYLINEAVDRSGLKPYINVIFGDAKSLLPTLSKQYDIIFIDANKREYSDYLSLSLGRIKPNGYILADNVLWYGKQDNNPKTLGIRNFNAEVDALTKAGEVESYLLEIRDGLYIIRVK